MAKKPRFSLQLRDWIILALVVVTAATNFLWYEAVNTLNQADNDATQNWIYAEAQIHRLKTCIDNNIKPCDISTDLSK